MKLIPDNYTFGAFKRFLKGKFDLDEDKAAEAEVIQNISKGVEFKGTNLWVLIFATFVASLGLNVNSAAVIIGAMLISPLMGPIMGIGLSIGTNDIDLLKRSLRNFGFMTLISILTSTVYFFLSPLGDAQSELLARTTPTTYDVLIAFFGGLAGIVAQSRKDRTSTVIPGVAIATALMPPLCTAGYGLASGELTYFIGALYLFFINTIFIALATFIIVRYLKYEKKEFLDKRKERKVHRYMALCVIIAIVPSIFIGYGIIQHNIFENNANRYVASVFKFDRAQVIDVKKHFDRHGSSIEIVLVGEPISEDAIENTKAQLPAYGLANTTVTIHQGSQGQEVDISMLQSGYTELLKEKNRKIKELETRLKDQEVDTIACQDIIRELSALNGNVGKISLARAVTFDHSGHPTDTTLISIINMNEGSTLPASERERIARWLQARTKSKNIKLYTE